MEESDRPLASLKDPHHVRDKATTQAQSSRICGHRGVIATSSTPRTRPACAYAHSAHDRAYGNAPPHSRSVCFDVVQLAVPSQMPDEHPLGLVMRGLPVFALPWAETRPLARCEEQTGSGRRGNDFPSPCWPPSFPFKCSFLSPTLMRWLWSKGARSKRGLPC